jgi:hypothetical protein
MNEPTIISDINIHITSRCTTEIHIGTCGIHSRRNAARNRQPPSVSTNMYRGEIGARHEEHFPRSASQERIGMFCHHLIAAPHFGQCDGGLTIDSPRGTRHMTTLRNDAMHAPSQNEKNARVGVNSRIMAAIRS